MRPNTLNVCKDKTNSDTKKFIREALYAWRKKARCNIVPAERLLDLFEELNFYPTEKQINEMLQTAKLFARRGSSIDPSVKRANGLTFGEFCVLASDLKRFRVHNSARFHDNRNNNNNNNNNNLQSCSSSSVNSSTLTNSTSSTSGNSNTKQHSANVNNITQVPTASISAPELSINTNVPITHNSNSTKITQPDSNAPEVFLGGSCNPTTWRADVAIPALDKLGISFYNPQVSDWTPDLIELEHRAKEKARVLFFVIDSETRASAGAIEAAHIAGQSSRHLVLVLHPYKKNQCILNEPISKQEFADLTRNQQLLRELVKRRALPVLDNIPKGLQMTREILYGTSERQTPYNIASRLISVRRKFDDIAEHTLAGKISIAQCQIILPQLGFAAYLLSTENLRNIIQSHREHEETLLQAANDDAKKSNGAVGESSSKNSNGEIQINFDEFCVITSYLAILQQEIHESGCISPIKGTNLPPPPIFLTNTPEWTHNEPYTSSDVGGATPATMTHHRSNSSTIPSNGPSYSKQIFRTNSCKSVPENRSHSSDLYRISGGSGCGGGSNVENDATGSNGRNGAGNSGNCVNSTSNGYNVDSGTSSPQPLEVKPTPTSLLRLNHKSLAGVLGNSEQEDESDSNDSVFSSGSSTDSNLGADRDGSGGNGGGTGTVRPSIQYRRTNAIEMKDIYLGGSCMIRTNWRKEFAIPFLNQKDVTYRVPNVCDVVRSDDDLPIDTAGSMSTETPPQKKNARRSILKRWTDFSSLGSKLAASSESSAKATNNCQHQHQQNNHDENSVPIGKGLYDPEVLDSCRVLLFVITNETRSLAPMTLAAHYIGLGYNVVLCIQMLPDFCIIGTDKLTTAAIKDYNRGRAYLIDLAKRQGVPVFSDLKQSLECAVEKVKNCNSRNSI